MSHIVQARTIAVSIWLVGLVLATVGCERKPSAPPAPPAQNELTGRPAPRPVRHSVERSSPTADPRRPARPREVVSLSTGLRDRLPTAAGEPLQQGVVVSVIGRTISLADTEVLTLRSPPPGIVIPVGNLEPLAKRLKERLAQVPAGRKPSLIIAAAGDVPYRTLASVLTTARNAGFDRWQVVVRQPDGSVAGLRLSAPEPARKPHDHVPRRITDAWGRPYWYAGKVDRKARVLFARDNPLAKESEDSLGTLIGTVVTKEESGIGGLGPGKGGAEGGGFGGWGGFGKGSAGPNGGGGFGLGNVANRSPSATLTRVIVNGGLDKAVVTRVVRRHLAEITYCYVSVGLPSDPNLRGSVTLRFPITSAGRTDRVVVASATLNHAAVVACLTAAAARWRYPKPAGPPPTVKVTFVFQPTK